MDKAMEHVSDASHAVLFDYDFLQDLNIIENTSTELS